MDSSQDSAPPSTPKPLTMMVRSLRVRYPGSLVSKNGALWLGEMPVAVSLANVAVSPFVTNRAATPSPNLSSVDADDIRDLPLSDTSSPSRSLRVLHVSHAVNTGLAHCVSDYVAYQISSGMSVALACPGGRLGELASAAGANVLPWKASREPGPRMIAEMYSLRGIVRHVQPDIIHLHCAKAGLVGRMLLRGKTPTVFSPHAWSFLASTGFMRRAVREWERLAARWTHVTACVSSAESTTGRAAGIRGRMAVLPNRVDTALIDELVERYRADVRAELGVSAGQPLVVLAARLARQKGQDLAIAAWNDVREAIPNADLAIIGTGRIQRELAAQAGEGVHFLGPLERADTLRWMYAADVIICPSRWEGMSLVPLEAAALGRPVIATDVDGMRESIRPDTGWLVPPENTAALAQQIQHVLANPSDAFDAGQNARRYFVQERTNQASSPQLLAELYRELAD